MTMLKMAIAALAALYLTAAPFMEAQNRTPQTHRLEASPSSVAYGYYWSEAKPALRIASGDIIDVDTLLTNTPMRLARAGVPDNKIQESLKAIVDGVTGDKRGPGGHILTGPVYVEGAEPGDALEVKILSIDFAIDYGYNGCSGFLPENCEQDAPSKNHSDRHTKTMTAEMLRQASSSRCVRSSAAWELRRRRSWAASAAIRRERHAGNLDNKELVARDRRCSSRCSFPARCFEIGDGHAAQGDGEVDQTAIETSLRGRASAHRPQRT